MGAQTLKCYLRVLLCGWSAGRRAGSGCAARRQAVLEARRAGALTGQLQKAQLARAGDGFRTPLDLKLAKDVAVVPFNRIQGEEKSFSDLMI